MRHEDASFMVFLLNFPLKPYDLKTESSKKEKLYPI